MNPGAGRLVVSSMGPQRAVDVLQFAGLPLHPLIVHATVVLTPLAVIAVALAALWPTARRRLGAVTPLAGIVVAVLAPLTVVAGESLADAVGRTPAISRHEQLGTMLVPWAVALGAVSIAQWVWFRFARPRMGSGARRLLRGADIAQAVLALGIGTGTVIVLVLAGDAGARAVWSGLVPS